MVNIQGHVIGIRHNLPTLLLCSRYIIINLLSCRFDRTEKLIHQSDFE